jgi:zinc protease
LNHTRSLRLFPFLVVASLTGTPLFGQATSGIEAAGRGTVSKGSTPRADQVLERYLETTGGRAAWERIHSRVSTGAVEIPDMHLTGTAELYEKAPDRALVKMVVGGSTFLEGFDGSVGWSSDPKDGMREQTGAQLAEMRRESDFRFPLDFRKLYKDFSPVSRATIGDRRVYFIEATPAEGGEPDRAYFEAQTGFLVRMIIQHHDDDGRVQPFEEDYGEYRLVDGVKIPFVIRQSGAQVDFTIRLKEVRQNVEVDDAQFAEPGTTVVK